MVYGILFYVKRRFKMNNDELNVETKELKTNVKNKVLKTKKANKLDVNSEIVQVKESKGKK